MASSTAFRLTTGSIPGIPRQTGQTAVFGCAWVTSTTAQEQNIFEGAKKAAQESKSPAAKQAFEQITKDYGRGRITKEEYLELLKGVPKITGKAQSPQDIARVEKAAKAAESSIAKREAKRVADMAEEAAKKNVPTSQLKGRKWVRDKDGKLVLEKK